MKAKTPPARAYRLTDQKSPPMTAEQVVRQIRIIRHSPRAPRIGRRVPGIRTIAKKAGLSWRSLYLIAETGRISPDQVVALGPALQAVQEGFG
jgi:hypothetical protein